MYTVDFQDIVREAKSTFMALQILLICKLNKMMGYLSITHLLIMLEGSFGPSSSNLITVSKSRETSSLEVQWSSSLSSGFIKQTVTDNYSVK